MACVGPDNPPRYEPTTYGAFSQRLLTLKFARAASRAADRSGRVVLADLQHELVGLGPGEELRRDGEVSSTSRCGTP